MNADSGALPPTAANSSLASRIRATMNGMPKTMVSLGKLLLDDPSLPVRLSTTALAEFSGVSTSTITRFSRLLGYEGYHTLRVSAAADLGWSEAQEVLTPTADLPTADSPSLEGLDLRAEPVDILRRFLARTVASLHASAALIDISQVELVAQKVVASGHVDIYGIGGSGTVVRGLAERLYNVGIDAHPWTETHRGLASAARLGPGCVALGISDRGRSDETVRMLAIARAQGAFVVAITGDPTSPLAKGADVVLQTYHPDLPHLHGSASAQLAQLFIADLLQLVVIHENYDASIAAEAAASRAVTWYMAGAPPLSSQG